MISASEVHVPGRPSSRVGVKALAVAAACSFADLLVMCHTGGGSIAGSQAKIDVDVLLAMRPQVAGHVNGGPTSLSEGELRFSRSRNTPPSARAVRVQQA